MSFDLIWLFILVLSNGFFVAAEFAIVKIRSSQIELQVKSGSRVAKISKNIIENLDKYLAATQLGITLSSLGLGWIGQRSFSTIFIPFLERIGLDVSILWVQNVGLIFAFLILTCLHVVLGELAPKSIAVQKPISTTLKVAIPLRVFYYVLMPLVYLFNYLANLLLKLIGFKAHTNKSNHSSEELQYLLDKGKESGVLNISEHELIKNVFDFNERIVKNIMVPRTKIVAVEVNDTAEVFIDTVTDEGYSRIPIYEDNIDCIVGVVHTKDLLPILVKGEKVILRDIMRSPYFIPETKKINDLLTEFQLKRIQIAFVLDEFGGTSGMVTLEDIVEELVGDIQDEYDEEVPVVEKLSDVEYMVDAGANLHDVNSYLPVELPESSDYDTVAGLVSELFEKIPDVGDSTSAFGYVFTIMRKTQQNIEFVKLDYVGTLDEDNII